LTKLTPFVKLKFNDQVSLQVVIFFKSLSESDHIFSAFTSSSNTLSFSVKLVVVTITSFNTISWATESLNSVFCKKINPFLSDFFLQVFENFYLFRNRSNKLFGVFIECGRCFFMSVNKVHHVPAKCTVF
jgi:hypothetical protein